MEGNSIAPFSKSFDYDGQPPTTKLLAPSNDDVLTSGRQVFRLLAQDNQAIDRVRFQLYSYDRERYWNGKNWQPSPTSVSGKGLANDRWTYALELGSGNYRVRGWSLDEAGNRSAKSGVADFQVVN